MVSSSAPADGITLLQELGKLQINEWALLLVVVAPMLSMLLSPIAFRRLSKGRVARQDDSLSFDVQHIAEQVHRLQLSQDQALQAVQVDVRNLSKTVTYLGVEVSELKATKRSATEIVRSRSPVREGVSTCAP